MPHIDMEQSKKYHHEYHLKNKEKILLYKAQYRKNNQDKIKALRIKRKSIDSDLRKEYSKNHRKEINNYSKLRYQTSDRVKELMWSSNVLRRFKMTKKVYDDILKSQGGVCAICGIGPEDTHERLSIDHDHSCCPGKTSCGECIRGLLCRKCNACIGMANDSIEILSKSIIYLKKYRD